MVDIGLFKSSGLYIGITQDVKEVLAGEYKNYLEARWSCNGTFVVMRADASTEDYSAFCRRAADKYVECVKSAVDNLQLG